MTLRITPLIALSILTLICFHLLSGCNDRIVDPPIKNSREYTWTIDTLAYPGSFQTAMEDIWGSSPTNMYVVGHNSGAFGKMYHYDGKKWKPVDLAFGAIVLDAIYGFGSNDIWVVGARSDYNPTPPPNFLDSSFIIRNDGTRWTEHKVTGGRFLLTIFGVSSTDVWAGGIAGTLYHYDGVSWRRLPMPDTISFRSITGFASNDIYALAYQNRPYGLNTNYLLHWDGVKWSIRESFTESITEEDRFGRTKLFRLSGRLYSVGSGVFQKLSSGWQRMFGNRFTGFQSLGGTDPNNFFAVGIYGLVYHFNGTDWFQFTQFVSSDIHYYACWTDGKEVFILGIDGGGRKSFVLHGR